jgi:predicted RNA-binding protein YlqC (UPF0109 family)
MGNRSNIRGLLERIIIALVDDSDKVEVRAIASDQSTIFLVTVTQPDIGKVIGKSGRTAKSLRVLLLAIAMKEKTRYTLDIASRPMEATNDALSLVPPRKLG